MSKKRELFVHDDVEITRVISLPKSSSNTNPKWPVIGVFSTFSSLVATAYFSAKRTSLLSERRSIGLSPCEIINTFKDNHNSVFMDSTYFFVLRLILKSGIRLRDKLYSEHGRWSLRTTTRTTKTSKW